MADPSRLEETRRRHDAALRALDSARRARRRATVLRRRLDSARARAALEGSSLAFTSFAGWEALLRTEGAAEKRPLAEAMAAAVIRVEGLRETALLEEIGRSLPGADGGGVPGIERFEALPPGEREREEARSESLRALLAVEGDRPALADALRHSERAEWQLARCRDCLAPVKIDFLFDLRGGGFHPELAKSGRLDRAGEYFLGARAALVRAEIAAAAVSGSGLPLDDAPFSPAAFWSALFADFANDGYVTTATAVLKAMVERLHELVAPLRVRAREAERDAARLEAELAEKEKRPPEDSRPSGGRS